MSKPAYPSEVCLAGWAKGLSMTFKRKPGYPVHWFSYNSTLKSLIVFLASPPRVPYESLKEFKWKLLFSLLTTCFTQALKPWLWLPLPSNELLLRILLIQLLHYLDNYFKKGQSLIASTLPTYHMATNTEETRYSTPTQDATEPGPGALESKEIVHANGSG